jgi:general secretion pathway protein D
MKISLTALLLALLLNSCAMSPPSLPGEEMIVDTDLEQSIVRLTQAVQENPNEVGYRTLLARTREVHVGEMVSQGQAALKAGDFDLAETRFRNALRHHPENPQAQAGLWAIDTARRNRMLLNDAEAAMAKGEYEVARSLMRSALAKEPDFAEASKLLSQAEEKIGKTRGIEFPQLAATFRRPITLMFKDAPIKSMFDAISRQSGLNFIFDKDVNVSQRSTVFAKDTALADVLDMLLATSQLSKKILNANTILVFPNTPVKQKDYQDMVVKSFFLSNANAKDTMNLIRTMAKAKDVFIDERLNMVAVRDTPEVVNLAEKLVAMTDRPEAEVMLHVEIMEVSGSKLQELGVLLPNQFSVVPPLGGGSDSAVRLTVDDLKNLNSGNIVVSPNPVLNLLRTDGNASILANPRIRVKNKEKARIHIGDKLPIITSNVTSTGVTSESVSYLDVGLKLDVEPLVKLEGDVEMKVGLEVSNISGTIKTANGTVAYQLGSRNATTVLRLRDGETQVLAGLISDAERNSANKVPGLGEIPLLGRLFTNKREEAGRSEIVLLITPSIIRNVTRPELNVGEFFAGTESNVSDQPLRLRPASRRDRNVPAQDTTPPPPVPEAQVEQPAIPAEPEAAVQALPTEPAVPVEGQEQEAPKAQ